MIRILAALVVGIITATLMTSCGLVTSTNRSVYFLFDASGTYAKAVPTAAKSANRLIARLQPGDWVGVAQISSCSFSEEEIVVQKRLSETPSLATRDKRALFDSLTTYSGGVKSTKFTDIHGALAQAAFELRQRPEAQRFIVVFSDMVEDTAKNCDTSKVPLDLTGIRVVASNVIKTNPAAPEKYFALLKEWERQVTEAGGVWQLAASDDQLPQLVASN